MTCPEPEKNLVKPCNNFGYVIILVLYILLAIIIGSRIWC